jgi:glyoxylase-like metal-dependent hydrolase (beta-lactamase superfamily II)
MLRALPILFLVPAALWTVVGGPLAAQQFPPGYVDPAPVLEAARKAIGVDSLRCVTISGSAYGGAVGQARLSGKDVDWPRIDALANYTRTMNWEAGTMKEEFDRKPGLNPGMWKYGPGWIGGTPLQQHSHQTFMLNGTHGWYIDGPQGKPTAVPPDVAEIWPVELYLNPHGFLKAAAVPGANPRAVWRWELGEMGRDGPETAPEKVTVVSITVNGKYRVDATINKEHLLQRIHTWVPDSVLGDMNYEHEFTNASYVDAGGGVRFPTGWHSHVGWDDNSQIQNVTAGHNAFGGTMKDVRPNVCPDAVAVPDSVRRAAFPVRVETHKLANGVYLLGGASHNSVAIEFKDFAAVVEAPLNEQRSLAVIEEIVKLMPGKPIRFLVNTHQHFDHLGGIRTYMHIGATIVTHWLNHSFYIKDVLNYAPRTLQPDMVSLWPPTELAEGYQYETVRENYVLSDGTRNLNMYYVNPLQHADGMLMAFLPTEKLLIEADLLDTDRPLPAASARDSTSFFNVIRKLKLDVAQIVPIHGKPIPWSDVAKIAGPR